MQLKYVYEMPKNKAKFITTYLIGPFSWPFSAFFLLILLWDEFHAETCPTFQRVPVFFVLSVTKRFPSKNFPLNDRDKPFRKCWVFEARHVLLFNWINYRLLNKYRDRLENVSKTGPLRQNDTIAYANINRRKRKVLFVYFLRFYYELWKEVYESTENIFGQLDRDTFKSTIIFPIYLLEQSREPTLASAKREQRDV